MVSRKIHPETGEELKFVVLAADGRKSALLSSPDRPSLQALTTVWDWTSSEEAALLLAAHQNKAVSPDIPKVTLPLIHEFTPSSEERKFPAQDLPGSPGRDIGSWVFEDDNSATHLVRNALGGMGWDKDVRRKVLSMREGGTRVVRDDTTVMCVIS